MKVLYCPMCGGNAKMIYLDDNEMLRWMCCACEFVGYVDEIVTESLIMKGQQPKGPSKVSE